MKNFFLFVLCSLWLILKLCEFYFELWKLSLKVVSSIKFDLKLLVVMHILISLILIWFACQRYAIHHVVSSLKFSWCLKFTDSVLNLLFHPTTDMLVIRVLVLSSTSPLCLMCSVLYHIHSFLDGRYYESNTIHYSSRILIKITILKKEIK